MTAPKAKPKADAPKPTPKPAPKADPKPTEDAKVTCPVCQYKFDPADPIL